MVGTLLFVMAGIVSRPLGFYLRGTDDYAGYAMAACGFLALAYTYKHGEHIRVSLLLERLGGRARLALEWAALALSTVVVGVMSFYSVRLAWQSLVFGEVSQGVDASPLWIPQLSMAVGAVVFFIALADDLVLATLGRPPVRLAGSDDDAVRSE